MMPWQGEEDGLIDRSRLEELRGEIGTEELSDLITTFLEESDALVAGLSTGLPVAQWAMVLHALKGCAVNIGLTHMAEICSRSEANPLDPEGREAEILLLKTCYAHSKQALQSLFSAP